MSGLEKICTFKFINFFCAQKVQLKWRRLKIFLTALELINLHSHPRNQNVESIILSAAEKKTQDCNLQTWLMKVLC